MSNSLLVLILLAPPLIVVLAFSIAAINRRMLAFNYLLKEKLEDPEVEEKELIRLLVKSPIASHEIASIVLIFYFIIVAIFTDGGKVTVLMGFTYIFSFLYLVLKRYSGYQLDSKIGAVEHRLMDYEEEGEELYHDRLCRVMIGTDRMDYKSLALQRMNAWGSPQCVAVFKETRKDPEPIILELAGRYMKSLKETMGRVQPDSWIGFDELIENYIYWRRISEEMKGEREERMLPRLMDLEIAPRPLRNFFKVNWKIHREGLQGFCKDDLKKAEYFETGGTTFIRCPDCGKVTSLASPVSKIVGQVGGNDPWKLHDGVLTLQLWDQEDKKALVAEVDEIDVIPMEKADWPLVAVLESFSNVSLPTKPKVRIAERVSITPNTKEIVHRFSQEEMK